LAFLLTLPRPPPDSTLFPYTTLFRSLGRRTAPAGRPETGGVVLPGRFGPPAGEVGEPAGSAAGWVGAGSGGFGAVTGSLGTVPGPLAVAGDVAQPAGAARRGGSGRGGVPARRPAHAVRAEPARPARKRHGRQGR